jgi:hypothetical protein
VEELAGVSHWAWKERGPFSSVFCSWLEEAGPLWAVDLEPLNKAIQHLNLP